MRISWLTVGGTLSSHGKRHRAWFRSRPHTSGGGEPGLLVPRQVAVGSCGCSRIAREASCLRSSVAVVVEADSACGKGERLRGRTSTDVTVRTVTAVTLRVLRRNHVHAQAQVLLHRESGVAFAVLRAKMGEAIRGTSSCGRASVVALAPMRDVVWHHRCRCSRARSSSCSIVKRIRSPSCGWTCRCVLFVRMCLDLAQYLTAASTRVVELQCCAA